MNYTDWEKCGPQLVSALESVAEWCSLIKQNYPEMRFPKEVDAALARYRRASAPGGGCDFLRARFGKNWVLARRTARIVERYGADVACLTPKQYAQAEADYLDGLPAIARAEGR